MSYDCTGRTGYEGNRPCIHTSTGKGLFDYMLQVVILSSLRNRRRTSKTDPRPRSTSPRPGLEILEDRSSRCPVSRPPRCSRPWRYRHRRSTSPGMRSPARRVTRSRRPSAGCGSSSAVSPAEPPPSRSSASAPAPPTISTWSLPTRPALHWGTQELVKTLGGEDDPDDETIDHPTASTAYTNVGGSLRGQRAVLHRRRTARWATAGCSRAWLERAALGAAGHHLHVQLRRHHRRERRHGRPLQRPPLRHQRRRPHLHRGHRIAPPAATIT